MKNITIIEKSYQRNGITGRGFLQVKYRDENGVVLFAILPIQDDGKVLAKECYVFNALDLKDHYRGDVIGARFAKMTGLLS